MGVDRFPRVRIGVDAENFPKKTKRAASLLQRAWNIIDEDSAYFDDMTVEMVARAKQQIEAGEPLESNFLVVTRIGRNVVRMTIVSPNEADPSIPQAMLGEFDREEFVEKFDGFELPMNDGRRPTLIDGVLEGEPDGLVVRRSNAAAVFIDQS